MFKYVCVKIGGDAKTKLLATTHVNKWEQAKAVKIKQSHYRPRQAQRVPGS